MGQAVTYKVDGLEELIRAADASGKATKKLVRDELRTVAKPVLEVSKAKLARYDAKSAARLGISIRKVGTVSVEQRLRRTTGAHPDFGVLQMERVLMPALGERETEVIEGFEKALDEIEAIFRKG